MSDAVTLPRLLTVAEVAKYLGMSTWQLYQMFKRGDGPPHFKVGKRRYKVAEPALAAWVEQQSQVGRKEK